MRQFKWALSARQIFEWQKMAVPEALTDIQRAARFFYLQHHPFGAKATGQTPPPDGQSTCCESRKTYPKPGSVFPAHTSKICLG